MVETPQETGKFERELFMQVDAKLLAAAQKVVADGNLKLQSCLPDTSRCLVPAPVVQVQPDRAGASASIFVDNDSWRKFLDQKLKVSTTDMETSAAAQVCKAFGVPFLAFRSASDKAGGDPSTNEAGVFSDLAAGSAAVAMVAVMKAASSTTSSSTTLSMSTSSTTSSTVVPKIGAYISIMHF
ncbi:unnamed protein product [Polarella glacialis]|uniref:Nucleoside phosphorylase domain-containing protein n=1 Tax=Polarella glacialis TaxID=89957 RepID=A0A813FJ20_POLGL|nr:unnamed protein product [Polarella glacialis]